MSALEIIRSMSMEQARDISQAIRQTKIGDKEAAHAIMEGMDADTLDLLIAYIETVQAERKGVSKTDSKDKARATREAHQEAQRLLWAEQRAAISAARAGLQRVMEATDATTAEILEAARLLAEIAR